MTTMTKSELDSKMREMIAAVTDSEAHKAIANWYIAELLKIQAAAQK